MQCTGLCLAQQLKEGRAAPWKGQRDRVTGIWALSVGGCSILGRGLHGRAVRARDIARAPLELGLFWLPRPSAGADSC